LIRAYAERYFHFIKKMIHLLHSSKNEPALNGKSSNPGPGPSKANSFAKKLGKKLVVFYCWAFYLPTIAGTFWLPMWVALVIVLPTIFNYFPESPASIMIPLPQWFFRLFYFSWIPLMIFPETLWLTDFLLLPEIWTNTEIWFLINLTRPFITILGLALFLASLAQLVWAKRKGIDLFTSGFYSVLRHPQYLGIIIWTFGHVLYSLPLRLRPADFLAWVTLVFLYLLLADLEERKLQEEIDEEKYSTYKNRVPFILPLVKPGLFKWLNRILPSKRWKRLLLFLAVYMLTIGLSVANFWGKTYCDWSKTLP